MSDYVAETQLVRNPLYFEREEVVDHYDHVVSHGLYDFEQVFLNLIEIPIARSRVLDLGCGAGREAIALAQLGAEVTAVDGSFKMIGRAAANARAAQVKLILLRSNCKDLPCEQNSFDWVFATHNFIEHIPSLSLRRSILLSVSRVLTDAGLLILCHHDRCSDSESVSLWEGEERQLRFPHHLELDGCREDGDLHVLPLGGPCGARNGILMHFFCNQEIDDELRGAGFHVLLRQGITSLTKTGENLAWHRTTQFVAARKGW